MTSANATTPTWSVHDLRRISVDEYHRMIAAGILNEDDPVELLEGWIVRQLPRGPAHDGTLQLLTYTLRDLLPAGWRVRVRCGWTTQDSEPEPDVAVVTGDLRAFMERHPGPQDTALVVEVAAASLERDRHDKARLYARAGLSCYWVVNLVDRQIEVLTHPVADGERSRYARYDVLRGEDSVGLVVEGRIPVTDLLL
jgi:hypothetical protein